MSMYCMQCSAIGVAPLTVACSCGSVRWRGTYELPSKDAGVTIGNRSGTRVNLESGLNRLAGSSEDGDRSVLEMVDAIRRMITEGRVHVPGLDGEPRN